MEDESKNGGTEEEQIALANRLDKELDAFIAKLERKTYKGGLKPEEWDKEIGKHPFFMNEAPASGETSTLQQFKYNPNEDPPEELAAAYKEEGNFHFRSKNYRKAIIAYTKGLNQLFHIPHLKAQLHTNRAVSLFCIKHYRCSYCDGKLALKEYPDYSKAKRILAQACAELGKFRKCIQLCDSLLLASNDPVILKLRTEVAEKKKIKEINEQKERAMRNKQALEHKKLKEMIDKRGIKFLGFSFWENPKLEIPHKVFIEENHLVWPVVLLYPEYKTSDLIQNFHEDSTFEEQLSKVFREFPEWDTEQKYTPDSVVIHYEDVHGRIHGVKKSSTLLAVLSEADFRVDGSSPAFIIHAKGSAAYESFLKNYD